VADPKQIDQDILRLREMGFNPDAPAAEALAKLRELRTSRRVSDIAIARALGNVADPDAVRMLTEMEAEASGALRREIRRSLFRLNQRGLAVRQSGEPAPKTGTAGTPALEPGLHALVSPVDAEGAQIVWLMKPRPSSGLVRLWGLVSEDEGLVGANAVTLSRREFRAQRKELERRSGMKLVEADRRLADFILCDAYRRTPEFRRGAIGNFYAIRAEITAAPAPGELAHPIYSELAIEAAQEPALDLLKEPEIAACRIPAAELRPYVDEVTHARESPIVVSPASQEERVRAAVEKAVAELLGGERALKLRRRLEAAAYYMMKDGRRVQAGWAAAAAARIRDHADLRHIALFRALVEMQLGAVLAEEAERREAEPRLVVTPAEAIRAEQERRARMRAPRR
jgi:hypothetical protein